MNTEEPNRYRILIVDDMQSIACLTEAMIRAQFPMAAVVWVENGEDAYQKAVEWIPHLVIMDLEMPRINGVEAVVKLSSNSRTNHIPVILSTGNEFTPEEEASYLSLFAAVLSKKNLATALAPAIRTALGIEMPQRDQMDKLENPVLVMMTVHNFPIHSDSDRILSYLNFWNRQIGQLTHRHSGFITTSAPDVIVAVFPEQAEESNRQQAILFAHRSRMLVQELNKRFRMQLSLRCGIHWGKELLIHQPQHPKKAMPVVIGELVTITRLISETSDSMQISLSAMLHPEADKRFRLIERSPRLVNGFPMALWYLHTEKISLTPAENSIQAAIEIAH